MNFLKRWFSQIFSKKLVIEYCDVCHNREALPDTHLCPGPIVCGICDEEIIFVDPYGAFSKHPCFEK